MKNGGKFKFHEFLKSFSTGFSSPKSDKFCNFSYSVISNVESEGTENSKVKKVPLSVASMVRRFETTQNKTRGGGTAVTAELMEQRSGSGDLKSSLSSSSSPSSSQGHLNDQSEVTENQSATKTKTNQNKVRPEFLYLIWDKLPYLPILIAKIEFTSEVRIDL